MQFQRPIVTLIKDISSFYFLLLSKQHNSPVSLHLHNTQLPCLPPPPQYTTPLSPSTSTIHNSPVSLHFHNTQLPCLPNLILLPPPSPNWLTFSIAKMWWLKYCCNCSLAKLMQNCSKLLWTKISNPKMSRMPTAVSKCGIVIHTYAGMLSVQATATHY